MGGGGQPGGGASLLFLPVYSELFRVAVIHLVITEIEKKS